MNKIAEHFVAAVQALWKMHVASGCGVVLHVACKCTNNMHCILILKFATIKIFSTIAIVSC